MVAVCDNRSDIANVQCALCGTVYSIFYNRKDMLDWLSGQNYIQDAMPYLTPSERELLISRTCGDCFDKMFPPDLDITE
jgi:hypothetical protein